MVRLRQLIDRARHRLLFIPVAFVLLSIGLSQLMLWGDRQVDDNSLPRVLLTTVDSGRSILSSIAAGLISSVTLLLSLMLVAVQLAGSQFSPRTLRDWIGDVVLQRTIGIVLGTTVYCLLILRETRSFGEGDELTPHLSVLVALALGVFSLIAVVRSVDHLTDSLRIGSVAGRIMTDTVTLIETDPRIGGAANPAIVPAAQPGSSELAVDPPPDAMAITAAEAGWVQQIDVDAILRSTPESSTTYITAALGTFAMPDAPMAWVWPPPETDDCVGEIRSAIALGDTRTMQQDIGFGILQMVDIALRALSPGINDPNTASDIIVHMGAVMLALWEQPMAPTQRSEDDRTIVRHDLIHNDYLHAGFDQLRRYGSGDPEVAATIIRVLASLHTETIRRELVGPLEPIEEVIDQTIEAVDASDLSDYDKDLVRTLAPDDLRRLRGRGPADGRRG